VLVSVGVWCWLVLVSSVG